MACAQQRVIQASRSLVAYELQVDAEWELAIAERLQAGADPGDAAADRRARHLAGCIMGLTRAVLREWFAADGAPDLVASGAEGFDGLEAGFGLRGR